MRATRSSGTVNWCSSWRPLDSGWPRRSTPPSRQASEAEVYGKVVREHLDSDFKNVGDLIDDIKKAAEVRNALCHGSWRSPDTSGRSALFYFSKKDGRFDSKIDTAWLRQVQAHVIDLICAVISSVTVMGWQFPGGAGPGEVIWSK